MISVCTVVGTVSGASFTAADPHHTYPVCCVRIYRGYYGHCPTFSLGELLHELLSGQQPDRIICQWNSRQEVHSLFRSLPMGKNLWTLYCQYRKKQKWLWDKVVSNAAENVHVVMLQFGKPYGYYSGKNNRMVCFSFGLDLGPGFPCIHTRTHWE